MSAYKAQMCQLKTKTAVYSLILAFLSQTMFNDAMSSNNMSRAQFNQRWQRVMLLVDKGHWAAARPILLELAQSEYADKQVYSKLADSFSIDIQGSDRDLNSAEVALGQALEKDPEWGEAWRQKAALAIRKEQFKQAVTFANKALSCKEPDIEALYQRAKAYAALKEYVKALADDEQFIKHRHSKINPNNPIPGELSLQANLLEQLNRYDEAIVVYREMELHNFDGANLNIVRCLRLENKLPEAISEVSQLVKRNPSDDMAYFQRAQLKVKANDLHGALTDYSKAIELSQLTRYYLERAKVYDALHKTKEAAADRQSATKDF